MKNALLALLAIGILVTWILSTENQGKDPRISWRRAQEAPRLLPSSNPDIRSNEKASPEPGTPPTPEPGNTPTPASVAVPVKDAALHGCFEGTLEGSGNGTLQLFFFRALEPEEERYRLTLEQGGVRHPWQGPVGSFRALPHRPGFASGYEMPLESTRSAEIYYNSELRSWSGTLYSISGSGPSSAPRKSTGNFVLKQTNHCQ